MMPSLKARPAKAIYIVIAGFLALGAVRLIHGTPSARAAQQNTQPPQRTPGSGPVPPADRSRPTPVTIQPEELARDLSGASKPIIVCVGPHVLYEGAHVPGAIYHGPASTAEGMNDLRQWAGKTPKDANIVLYCGCCPAPKCPNIRPALEALRQMGFTHVRVLYLPTDFHTDWMGKNLPVEKGG